MKHAFVYQTVFSLYLVSHILRAPGVGAGVRDFLPVYPLVEPLLEARGPVDAVPAVPGRDLEAVRGRQRTLIRRNPWKRESKNKFDKSLKVKMYLPIPQCSLNFPAWSQESSGQLC